MKSKTLVETKLTFDEEELQALAKATEVLDSLLYEVENTDPDEVVVHSDCNGETHYVKRTLDKVLEVLDTLACAREICMETKYDDEG